MAEEVNRNIPPAGGDGRPVPAPPPATNGAAPPEAAPEDRVADLERDLKAAQEEVLRAVADYQNFARRARQNITEARQQQLVDAAKPLLPVLDHFDRALHVDPATATVESLLQGVQMVREELLKALNTLGISRLEAKPGEPFDPHHHEALMHQPVEGMEPNRVAAQLEVGYKLGSITLRPAKVSVTR